MAYLTSVFWRDRALFEVPWMMFSIICDDAPTHHVQRYCVTKTPVR